MPAIAVRYDLRRAPFSPQTHAELYRACLDQCSWIEEHRAADIAVLSEHHGVDDGFCPSPFTLAAAIGARTTLLPVTIAAALLPLHDPVRFAEQAIVADLVTGGRVSFVVGIGYRDEEFAMAGVERKERVPLLEEYVEVVRKAWTGEPFEWRGRSIRVTPQPVSPQPPMLIGGGVEAAARRAARLRLPFLSSINDPALAVAYNDEAAAVGYEGGYCLLPDTSGFLYVTEDPDETWNQIARYAWYDADTYRSWQTAGTRSEVKTSAADVDALREEGMYRVLTPEHAIELVEGLAPTATVTLHPLICGIPLDVSWRSLELFRDHVLPRLRPQA